MSYSSINESDVVLTKEAFRLANFSVVLRHVENGEQCLAYLRKSGPYANAPTPDLILLDLNMPVMDGRAVLASVVRDPALCHLPVIILTTSSNESDILEMYKLRCSSYITKPVDFNAFTEAIRTLKQYWFSVAALPPDVH